MPRPLPALQLFFITGSPDFECLWTLPQTVANSPRHPLQRPYDGPFRVLDKKEKHFTLDVRGRKETVSIDRLKSAFVTQVGTGDNNKPLSEQAHPRPSVTIKSNPTPGAAATATAASFTPPEDNPFTTTRTGRIQRRPVRFR
ncbi:hypothetical protein RRG08_062810 [Elysia crispata]|uniref:Uncharacterized protein n=1 Tax=Elysia crispata TaxID=231223 RepID=A0AAE0Z286_9GAST|nr:hypothetical protein RRG08_062810 [Elysia crispata]